jgi:hypothetical protein
MNKDNEGGRKYQAEVVPFSAENAEEVTSIDEYWADN